MPKNTLKYEILKKYSKSAEYLGKSLIAVPDIAIVAGSGFADFFENAEVLQTIDYSAIPNMPLPTVDGHAGSLLLARFGGKVCMLFLGRFHVYEGRRVDEIACFSIISHLLGISSIILTNAAGGLSPNFELADAMIVNDSINFLYCNENELFDCIPTSKIKVYSKEWINLLKQELVKRSIPFQEGVYLSTSGPSYETPAEIRFFRKIGADAAGMSTVIEAATAARLGMNCIAVSMITNCLKEVSTAQISHDEILSASSKAKPVMSKLLEAAVEICL